MTTQPYPISHLSLVLFGLSAMLDTGKHDNITVDDIKKHSRKGDLLDYLTACNGAPFAMGFPEHEREFGRWYAAQIDDLCKVGRERKKYAIENRGLCLLISFTAEIIQHGQGTPRPVTH